MCRWVDGNHQDGDERKEAQMNGKSFLVEAKKNGND